MGDLDLEALLLKASLCDEAEDRRDREVVRYLLFEAAEAGAHGKLDCLGGITFLSEGGHRGELTFAGALCPPLLARPLLHTVS